MQQEHGLGCTVFKDYQEKVMKARKYPQFKTSRNLLSLLLQWDLWGIFNHPSPEPESEICVDQPGDNIEKLPLPFKKTFRLSSTNNKK